MTADVILPAPPKEIKEHAVCPYCGGEACFLVSSTDRNRHVTELGFNYYRCSQCDLIFLSDPPEDMGAYYRGGYDSIPQNYAALKSIAEGEKYRTEPVLQYKSQGKFLEIGPWRGVICANMKEAGFDVTAVEMNQECVDFLQQQVGIQAIQSSDPAMTMEQLGPGFDVITAWHSLEHLPRPWRVVEQAARLLVPGGVLQLAMPNPESYEFAVLKDKWMHLDAPRHLNLYSLEALVSLCRKQGLEPLQMTTADRFSFIQSRHAWRSWARSWLPLRYVRSVIGDLAYWFAYNKQATEGSGSAYTALFVKT